MRPGQTLIEFGAFSAFPYKGLVIESKNFDVKLPSRGFADQFMSYRIFEDVHSVIPLLARVEKAHADFTFPGRRPVIALGIITKPRAPH